jgi:hypothetical protein
MCWRITRYAGRSSTGYESTPDFRQYLFGGATVYLEETFRADYGKKLHLLQGGNFSIQYVDLAVNT